MDRRLAAAGEHPEPDLDHAHHRQHQEQAPHDRSHGGGHHPEPEDLQIDVGPERLVNICTVEQVDGELQPLRDQRREQEEAERHHLEHQQLLCHRRVRVARRPLLQAALPRRRQRQPHEDRDREQRVHVNQTVQRRHVDAGRPRRR